MYGLLYLWRHLVAKFATNANGAIWWPILQLMQVTPPCGQILNLYKWNHIGQICNQIWNLCKWRHLVANLATNSSGAIWWTILQLMQIAPPGGQNWNQLDYMLAKFGTNSGGNLF